MANFIKVTDNFAVTPQITLADIEQAAAQGFRLVINNRPDGEEPGQPTSVQMQAAAQAAGVNYLHIPVVGGPTPDQVEQVHLAVQDTEGPVLAFCRSGTRSIVTWSIGQALSDERTPEELITLGAKAGYDLSSVLRR
jgi:uncharacterized protein (TIGR01244 family)